MGHVDLIVEKEQGEDTTCNTPFQTEGQSHTRLSTRWQQAYKSGQFI
jgi:hypothetical protein